MSEPRPRSRSLAELDADCVHSFGCDPRKPWSPQRMPDARLLWGSEVALILMCRKSEGLIKEWGTAVLRSKGPGW